MSKPIDLKNLPEGYLEGYDPTALLLPYQTAWIADKSRVKVMEKSRRTGISWADAAEAALIAMSSKQSGGMNCFYMAYNKDMTQQYIQDVKFWAGVYHAVVGDISEEEEVWKDGDEDRSCHIFRIQFDSGFKVEALSGAPKNLRSKQGRLCFDEAAFHDNPGEVLKAGRAFMIWGGIVAIISTHNGVDNPFNELVEEIKAKKRNYTLHRVTFDDAISQGLCKRIFQLTGQAWSPQTQTEWRQGIIDDYQPDADEELFCIPSQSGGTALSRALILSRMHADRPVLRLARDDAWALQPEPARRREVDDWLEEHVAPLLDAMDKRLDSFLGEDFGRSGDLTDLLPGQTRRDLTLTVPFVVELRNIPFKQQQQVIHFICDRLPNFRKGAFDARGNGSQIAEEAADRYGHDRIEQIMLTERWYMEEMPPYLSAFQDALIELPLDVDILKDHRLLRSKRGVTRIPDDARFRGADGGQRHGDSAIAGALLYYASRQDVEIYEEHSIRPRPEENRMLIDPNRDGRADELDTGRSRIGRVQGAF